MYSMRTIIISTQTILWGHEFFFYICCIINLTTLFYGEPSPILKGNGIQRLHILGDEVDMVENEAEHFHAEGICALHWMVLEKL